MDQQQIFVQMVLKAWNIQVTSTTQFFDALDDQSLDREVAPGKNRIIYLMGHLIAVNDTMISLFGVGERLYAHFDQPFVKNPDKSEQAIPEASDLRKEWRISNEVLTAHFGKISPADWFKRHTAMTDEDLVKDPGRNKLSVLINRTNHLANHLGQLLVAK